MEFNYGKFSAPVNTLIASALSLMLVFLSGTVLSLFQLFLIFPFTVLWVYEGWRWTFLGYLITGGISSLIFNPASAIVSMTFIVILSMVMGTLIERRALPFHELMIPALVYMTLAIVTLWVGQKSGSVDLGELFREAMKAGLQGALDTGKTGPQAELALRNAIDQAERLVPSILFLMGLVTALITSAVSRAMLSATGEDTAPFHLSFFEIPAAAGRVIIFSAIIGWGCAKFLGPQYQALGENLFFGSFWIFTLDGLAVMDTRLKGRMGKFSRIFLYLLLLLFFLSLLALFVVGMIDFFIRFRSRSQGGNHDPSEK